MTEYDTVFAWFFEQWAYGFVFSMAMHFVWLVTGAGKWFTYFGG